MDSMFVIDMEFICTLFFKKIFPLGASPPDPLFGSLSEMESILEMDSISSLPRVKE